jgi:hypothetical protein
VLTILFTSTYSRYAFDRRRVQKAVQLVAATSLRRGEQRKISNEEYSTVPTLEKREGVDG